MINIDVDSLKNEVFKVIALPHNREAKAAAADLKNLRSVIRAHLSAHDTGKQRIVADEIAQGIELLKQP